MVSLIEPTWLRDLPKVELHVHLEGSISVATIAALSERHSADLLGAGPTDLVALQQDALAASFAPDTVKVDIPNELADLDGARP